MFSEDSCFIAYPCYYMVLVFVMESRPLFYVVIVQGLVGYKTIQILWNPFNETVINTKYAPYNIGMYIDLKRTTTRHRQDMLINGMVEDYPDSSAMHCETLHFYLINETIRK